MVKRESFTSAPRRGRRCESPVLCAIIIWAAWYNSPPPSRISSLSELIFSSARASERERENGDRGDRGDRGDNGGGGQRSTNDGDNGGDNAGRRGDDNNGKGDNIGQGCCKGGNDGLAASQSGNFGGHQSSSIGNLSYDANRNMLHLRLKVDGSDSHDKERSSGHAAFHAGHGDEISRGMIRGLSRTDGFEGRWKDRDVHIHGLGGDDWRAAKAANTLGETLAPLEKHFHRILGGSHPTTTVVSKTKFAIGTLSFSSNEILGVNMDAVSVRRAEELGFQANSSSLERQQNGAITRLTVPPGLDAIRAQELLKTELPASRFELNHIYRLYRAAVRDDPGQPKQTEPATLGWAPACAGDRCAGQNAIHWQGNLGHCARGLRVGVIDTEIDAGHPAFAGQRLHRKSFTPDNRPVASDWHGTGVLALLAGNPASATPGLIPEADFFAASIFFSEENGEMATDTNSLLKALQWMDASNVKLVNMSFSGPRDDIVREAIERMSSKGVVFVAAAGNEGPTAEPSYPAAYKPVVAVTAVTSDLHNYRYANRGDHIDVAAPGVDVWTAVPGRREGYHSGTSFAAPFVTGVLAVLPRDNLRLPKEELLESLQFVDLGISGRDPVYGRGLLLAPTVCNAPTETVASAAR
jgi:subtilisin family serine protease